jgi:hypothetical protein
LFGLCQPPSSAILSPGLYGRIDIRQIRAIDAKLTMLKARSTGGCSIKTSRPDEPKGAVSARRKKAGHDKQRSTGCDSPDRCSADGRDARGDGTMDADKLRKWDLLRTVGD